MSATTGDPAEGAGGFEEAPLSARGVDPARSSSPWSSSSIAGWLFSVLFAFLRSRDANRFLVVLVAIGIGVGGVFFLFWGDEQGRRLASRPASVKGVRPYVFVGPRLVILSVFLVYPVFNTILTSASRTRRGQNFVGLDNFKFVFTDPSMLTLDPEHAWVDRRRSARRGQHRPRCSRRSPTGSVGARRSRSRMIFLPDGDLLRRGVDHVPADLQLPADGVRQSNIGLLNGIMLGLGQQPGRHGSSCSRGTTCC